MKHRVLKQMLATVALLLCSMAAMAETVTVNGITYEVDATKKTAAVIEKSGSYTGSIVIPETVEYYGVAYRVTTIGSWAFSVCTGLTNVTIPNSVTEIGDYAFSYCNGLTSVTIPNSVTEIGDYAFSDCTGLTSVTIPNSVTTIGMGAFEYCTGLTNVTIPNSVTAIGNHAFQKCTGLTNVTIPNSVTEIGDYAFSYCNGLTSVTIPNSVTEIGDYAFSDCTGLTSVTIPNSVTTIGMGAFDFCAGLTNVTIPNSVTAIEDYTFKGCSGLETVVIGEGVKTIDNKAFANCENLTNVYCLATSVPTTESSTFNNTFNNTNVASATLHVPEESIDSYKSTAPWSGFGTIKAIENEVVIKNGITYELNIIEKTATVIESENHSYYGSIVIPETVEHNGEIYSVTAIGEEAFDNCSLTSVTIPNSVTAIGSYAFEGCTGLTSVTIPNSVTTIGMGAFDFCAGLTNVTIPNSVTAIEDYTFEGCIGLTSITIGNGVTTIGLGAFWHCTGLETVVIGEGVKTINNAFVNSENLTNVYCLATSVPSTDSKAFNNTNVASATLHVPEESIDSYKSTAPWSGFGTIKAITNEVELTYEFNTIEKTATVIASNGDKYSGDIVIPETVERNGEVYNVTAIGSYAFERCTGLTSITIPNSVTAIGEFAFSNCTDLTSINLGNGVTTIGEAAFWNCDGLTNVVIGDGVTEIGNNAFQSCDVLTSITIPNNVTVIGADVFLGCTELTSIVVESGNTKYDSREGCNAIIETATNTLIAVCNNTVIPEGVTRIGAFVFAYCTGLTSITIPNSVTTIGQYAFLNCTGLTSVTIGNGVTEIGSYAFYGCTEITDIYSYITAEDLFSISNTFDVAAYENATLHVPFGTAGIYSMFSAWNKFANIVEDDTIPMSLALVYNGVLEYASSILDDTAFGSHGLITSEAQLSTNAQEPTEGPIANLLDNDFMTYFHSTWSATNTTMAYHYLQIDLGEPLDAVALKYSKRTGTGFMADGSPMKVRVFATNDTNGEWNEVGVHRLSYTHAVDTVAVGYKAIVLDNSYRHIRLQVEQTVSNIRDKNNLYFNLSEIGAWEARFEEEHVAYKDVPSYLMDELKAALSEAKSELMAGNDNEATAGRLYDAFEAVKNYVPTGIEDVFDNSGASHSNLYYDLQGRVVENPSRGIYIHNGKKVFIK